MKSSYKDKKVEAQKRLNIISGQINGLSKMIDEDEYCIDLLNQSHAVQNALKGLDSALFERHLNTHVKHQFKKEEDLAEKELIALFKSINK